jgi:hypothetical protein
MLSTDRPSDLPFVAPRRPSSFLYYQRCWQKEVDEQLKKGDLVLDEPPLLSAAACLSVLRQCIRQARKGDGGNIKVKVKNFRVLVGLEDRTVRHALKKLTTLGLLKFVTRTPRFKVYKLGAVLLAATAHLSDR